MNSKNSQVPEDQGSNGTAASELPPDAMTVERIEKMLVRDMMSVVTLCNALLTDKELRMHLATFMQGRYLNSRNKPAQDPRQHNMFPDA